MENVFNIMDEGKNIFMFCLALTLLFIGMKGLNQLHTTTKQNINSSNVLYEQYKETMNKRNASYDEIIAVLLSGLENDIVVNGLEINATEYDYLQFDYSVIAKTKYEKDYIVDLDGNVVKVIYNSI